MAIIILFTFPDETQKSCPMKNQLIIGRGVDCDVVLKHPEVSSRHASITLTESGQLFFEDLESTNGSYCKRSLIKNVVLKIDDIVTICKIKVSIDQASLSPYEVKRIGFSSTQEKKEKKELTVPILKIKT